MKNSTGVLAAALVAGGALFGAVAPSAASAAPAGPGIGDPAPACVTRSAPGRVVRVTNNCDTTQRVRVHLSNATVTSCLTLAVGSSFTASSATPISIVRVLTC